MNNMGNVVGGLIMVSQTISYIIMYLATLEEKNRLIIPISFAIFHERTGTYIPVCNW